MKGSTSLERFDAVLGRLLDALSDPKRRGRTVVIVLATYWVAWTVYAVVAKQSQDFHFDMGEMVAWSREVTFGTPKHPPLPAWLVAAWFWIFPLTAWAYDLFAVGAAVVSLARLRQEFYRLPADREIFLERAVKEALHESGHMFGLVHCADRTCAMSLSTGVRQIDGKSASFCGPCAARARKAVNLI